ncbi:MAG: hypothetical protein U0R76_14000 [Candidatus Nanopelagicales bacterium]
MTRTPKRAIAVLAAAAAAWLAVALPAAAAYYVSSTSKISSTTPTSVTSGTYSYSGGTTTCSTSKSCMPVTASFPSNKTSVSGYLVVYFYRSSTNTNTSGTLLGSVTSPSFSVPSSSTATWSKTVAYQCKTLAGSATTYYYWAKASFMNTSGTFSSDTAVASATLKKAGGCAT